VKPIAELYAKIRALLERWRNDKLTGTLTFDIHFNQGGVKDCEVKTTTKL